jgi:hypothetical protein
MEDMQRFEEMQCIMVQLIIYDGSCIQKLHRYIKSHKGLYNMEEMQRFERMECIMIQSKSCIDISKVTKV